MWNILYYAPFSTHAVTFASSLSLQGQPSLVGKIKYNDLLRVGETIKKFEIDTLEEPNSSKQYPNMLPSASK